MSTQLLVSIKDATEVMAACRGGAAIVDIKDPTRGSLGAPSVANLQNILAAFSQYSPCNPSQVMAVCALSMALGELADWDSRSSDHERLIACAQGGKITYVKIGLAQTAQRTSWRDDWNTWATSMSASFTPVGVAYADWERANMASPYDILEALPPVCPGILIDTYAKDGHDLFSHCSYDFLAGWITRARHMGRWVALAGSLRIAALSRLLPLQPAYIAVRGGVCHGDRNGSVSEQLVSEWARQIADARGKHENA